MKRDHWNLINNTEEQIIAETLLLLVNYWWTHSLNLYRFKIRYSLRGSVNKFYKIWGAFLANLTLWLIQYEVQSQTQRWLVMIGQHLFYFILLFHYLYFLFHVFILCYSLLYLLLFYGCVCEVGSGGVGGGGVCDCV